MDKVKNITKDLEVIDGLFQRIIDLKDSYPDWYFYLEDVNPDLATRQQLMELIETAPTLEARYYIFGKLTLRMQLARLIGRDADMLEIVSDTTQS